MSLNYNKSISVFLTTIGRPTLAQMLDSLCGQLKLQDYLYIAVDGQQYFKDASIIINAFLHDFRCTIIPIYERTNQGYHGHGLRNKYQKQLQGDFILHADDDDIYLKTAISDIRNTCRHDQWNVYKFYGEQKKVINGNLIYGDIGTPSICLPNLPHIFADWTYGYDGDYQFYLQTWKNWNTWNVNFHNSDVPINKTNIFIYKVKPNLNY